MMHKRLLRLTLVNFEELVKCHVRSEAFGCLREEVLLLKIANMGITLLRYILVPNVSLKKSLERNTLENGVCVCCLLAH